MKPNRTVLVLTQVFPPDPAAVGQYLADTTDRLAAGNVAVLVLTSNRGYQAPSVRFPKRDRLPSGVRVRRLPMSSSGKTSLAARLPGQLGFVAQCVLRGLFTRRLGSVVCSTSPPFAAAAALLIGEIRRVPVHCWVMDINPDQAVVTGQIRASSPLVKALEWLNRLVLRRSSTVIVPDRLMAERLVRGAHRVRAQIEVVPPWPQVHAISEVDGTDNWFRRRHGLLEKRVIMYSGNHSPVNPLDTLLAAAGALEDRDDLVFVFVGGGLEKDRVDDAIAAGAPNLVSVPYQPFEALATSLSAADVHVVTMGDDMAGIVHPSKVYNAMLVGRPILYFGPRPSHVTDLLDHESFGWAVSHGDVDRAVAVLREIADADDAVLRSKGAVARDTVLARLDPTALAGRIREIVSGT